MILPMEKLENLCRRMNIHIGIITVPADSAQEVCDMLVDGGVRAIWRQCQNISTKRIRMQ